MSDHNCQCSPGGHGMIAMGCCQEHRESKEHLEAKKEMLEEKLKWVNDELGKK